MYKKKLEEEIRCPLEYGLKIFGGKWKSRVICVLNEKKILRYSQLRTEMANITDAVLAATLKELIADEIVQRKAYDEIPPRVEYSLTGKGKSVVPILQSICHWSGIFTKKESDQPDTLFAQCLKCDYKKRIPS
ncbi:MAG: helix-turn-helix domain-containing protein [Bacillota bacterium]|nr:helix-turn-helix domain-containing protein [Bacillota bacterium]